MTQSSEEQRLREVLMDWWMETSRQEAEATVPKVIEYGGTDLMDMGRAVSWITGQDLSDQEAAEFGVYWYLLGKVARWTAAIRAGRPVSDDTILDIAVYAKMAQRIRAVGGWPVPVQEEQQ